MRTKTLVATFFAIALILHPGAQAHQRTGRVSPRHTGEGRVYVKEAGFSIVPPQGWEAQSGTAAILSFIGPKADINPNFNVRSSPHDGTPLETMASQIKELVAKQIKNWKSLDEGALTIDGKKAYSLASQSSHELQGQNVVVKTLQFIIIGDNKKAYILTFTAVPSVFDQQRKLFETSAFSAQTD